QRGRDQRGQQPRDQRQRDPRESRRHDPRDQRGREHREDPGHEADLRDDDDVLRGDPYRTREDREARDSRPSQPPATQVAHDEEDAPAPAIAWGSEDDSAAPDVALAPDLPVDAPADDPDPLTYPLVTGPG